MRVAVRRYRPSDGPAVDRLNLRLAGAGVEHRVYKEDPENHAVDHPERVPLFHSLFIAVEDDEVRGGTWLREQDFATPASRVRMGWMKYPVSESLVDARYAGVPASMLLQVMRHRPHLMAAGMGGHDAAIARLLAGIGWTPSTVPFLFRICRPFRVMRGLRYARRKRPLRLAMDLAAFSGMAWLGHRLLAVGRPRADAEVSVCEEDRFSPWADEVWRSSSQEYNALAVRDAEALDEAYPRNVPGLTRLRISRGSRSLGWACLEILGESQRHFGDLKVGMITDTLARPDDAIHVLAASSDHLEKAGADLVVVYLSHEAWIRAAKRLRFFSGPSTFALYASKEMTNVLGPDIGACHLTRTDGHGHAA